VVSSVAVKVVPAGAVSTDRTPAEAATVSAVFSSVLKLSSTNVAPIDQVRLMLLLVLPSLTVMTGVNNAPLLALAATVPEINPVDELMLTPSGNPDAE
jgi:hypothetical protein